MNESSSPQHEITLVDYIKPLLSRKWLILAILVLVTGGTYVYYARKPKQYTASTQLYLAASSSANLALGTAAASQPLSANLAQDEANLLMSRGVAAQVVKTLHLSASPDQVLATVRATPTTGADFVVIKAVEATPTRAANVANQFAQTFIDLTSRQSRQSLQGALAQAQQQLASIPHTPANLTARQTTASTVRELQLAVSLPNSQAQQVQSALPPSSASFPHPVRSALYGFALALLAAIALAYGLERFDRRIKHVADAENAYSLPLLSILPHSKDVAPEAGGRAKIGSDLREPSRMLRTNIQLSGLTTPIKSILVTSAVVAEGKSTVIRNLAIAYREFGRRVVVVEGDLRRPGLSKLLGIQSEAGFTTVLTGEYTLNEALHHVAIEDKGLGTLAQMEQAASKGNGASSHIPASSEARQSAAIATAATDPTEAAPTLQVLPAGPLAADPQAIFAARRTESLLKHLSSNFDIMLIDSPPLLSVSDAVPLASQVDAVIVVCRMGMSTRIAARRLMQMLRRIPGANPIGVVVNDVETFGEGSYYGYSSYYRSADRYA